MGDDEKDKIIRETAKVFKEGWDRAGREGFVSPELSKALQEDLGIHPERVQDFVTARQAHMSGRGNAPDPADYKEPKIVPIHKKKDDGYNNNGGPS